jgi:hypothetical protein
MIFELEHVLCQIVVNFTKDQVKDYFNKIILMVKNLDDSNLLPTFKNNLQLKIYGM